MPKTATPRLPPLRPGEYVDKEGWIHNPKVDEIVRAMDELKPEIVYVEDGREVDIRRNNQSRSATDGRYGRGSKK